MIVQKLDSMNMNVSLCFHSLLWSGWPLSLFEHDTLCALSLFSDYITGFTQTAKPVLTVIKKNFHAVFCNALVLFANWSQWRMQQAACSAVLAARSKAAASSAPSMPALYKDICPGRDDGSQRSSRFPWVPASPPPLLWQLQREFTHSGCV